MHYDDDDDIGGGGDGECECVCVCVCVCACVSDDNMSFLMPYDDDNHTHDMHT